MITHRTLNTPTRLLLIALIIALTACSNPNPNPSPSVNAVTVNPSSSSMLSGSSQTVSVTVSGTLDFDRTVNWTTSAGTLQKTQGSVNTFTAPVVQTATAVTLTAISAANPSASGTATIAINPVAPIAPTITSVTVSPVSSTLDPATTTTLSATVTGTGAFSPGINWEIVSGAGSLNATTGASVSFTAPSQAAASVSVIRATSVQDPSKTATATLNIKPNFTITGVTVTSSRVTLRLSQSAVLTATVTGTGAYDKGVKWKIEADGTGSLSSTTGNTVVYQAPVIGNGRIVRITAMSVQDERVRLTTLVSITPSTSFLTAGGFHSLAVTNRGIVAWGSNVFGQLGDGTTTNRTAPVLVSQDLFSSGISSISAGGSHSLALKGYQTLLAWGDNRFGQLGDGTTTNRSKPVLVSNSSDMLAIAAGEGHSLALNNDGTLLAWGNNSFGQLGDGTTTNRSTPVAVLNATNIVAIAAGSVHSLALKSDGTLLAWGDNRFGQLGDGTTTNRSTPVAVSNATNIVAIAAGGGEHSLALKSDGTLLAWGLNSSGQLGDGTTTNRPTPVAVLSATNIVAIAAGGNYSLVLNSDGTLLASPGQFGNGTTTNRPTFDAVLNASDIVAIAAGNGHSLALRGDGSLFTWGYNGAGQLGDGTTTNRSIPIFAFLIN